MHHHLVMIALAISLSPDFVCAQEQGEEEALADVFGSSEMISLATGTKKAISRAPSVATVITAQEIADSGARSIDEVLESVPGLHVSRSGLSRLDPSYGMRGITTGYTQQTLILLNGIRFSVLSTGSRPPTFRLPVGAIERIEVIRGPGSAVHGADAFSGVINIVTKEASAPQTAHLAARKGSFDTTDWLVQWAQQFESWQLGLSIESQKSDGDDDRIIDHDLQSTLDAVLGTSVSLAPGPLQTQYNVLNSHITFANEEWNFHYWNWKQTDAGQGQGGAQTLDFKGNVDVNQHLYIASYEDRHSEKLAWGGRYSYQYTKYSTLFQLFPDGAVLPIGADGNINFFVPAGIVAFPDGVLGNPGATEKLQFMEFYVEYNVPADHHFRFSVGGRNDESSPTEYKNFGPGVIDGSQPIVNGNLTDVTNTSNIYQPDEVRHVSFISIQDEWQLAADWELTAGLRYDRYSDFGKTTNPRIALVWAAKNNLTAKLLYGRAFRAPSFAELYYSNNPVSLGNPDLSAERIATSEIAFDYTPSSTVHVVFSVFEYEADDLIEFVPDAPNNPASTNTAQNARTQDGKGAELELNWQISEQFLFRANLSYQHATDAETDDRIADVPAKHAYLHLGWRLNDTWRLTTQSNWIADRARASADTRADIDDYVWTDITLRGHDIFENVDASVSVRNLFDTDARDPSNGTIPDDYPLEGKSAWLELTYRFPAR